MEATHISYEVAAIFVEACLAHLKVPARAELIELRLRELDQIDEHSGGPEAAKHIPNPGVRVPILVVRMIGRMIQEHSTDRIEIASVPEWMLHDLYRVVRQLPTLSKTLERVVDVHTALPELQALLERRTCDGA